MEPDRLSPRVRSALEAVANEKWLSPVSVWETLLLAERGRIQLDPDPIAWVHRELARLPFRQASLTHEVAIESRRSRLDHPDPADSFLVATARVYDLTLVTADARLVRGKPCPILPNL